MKPNKEERKKAEKQLNSIIRKLEKRV